MPKPTLTISHISTYLFTYLHTYLAPLLIPSTHFLLLSRLPTRLNPPHSRRKSHIPSPRRPLVQPLPPKPFLREELPSPLRIDARQIPVQDPLPATDVGGRIGGRVVEVGVPFLGDEVRFADVRCRRDEGEHVDALDVFGVVAEVGCVVDFVFKELGGWLVGWVSWMGRGGVFSKRRREDLRCR